MNPWLTAGWATTGLLWRLPQQNLPYNLRTGSDAKKRGTLVDQHYDDYDMYLQAGSAESWAGDAV